MFLSSARLARVLSIKLRGTCSPLHAQLGLFCILAGRGQGQPHALGTAAGLATDPQRSMNLRFLRDQLPRRRLPAAAPVGSPCHWLPEALYAA